MNMISRWLNHAGVLHFIGATHINTIISWLQRPPHPHLILSRRRACRDRATGVFRVVAVFYSQSHCFGTPAVIGHWHLACGHPFLFFLFIVGPWKTSPFRIVPVDHHLLGLPWSCPILNFLSLHSCIQATNYPTLRNPF